MYPYVLKLLFPNCHAHAHQCNDSPAGQQESDSDDGGMVKGFVKPGVSEFVGSLLFVLITTLLGYPNVNPQLSAALFEGGTVFLLMCMLGKFSGAHLNPAVTISVMISGHCRIGLAGCIVFMQFFGSFVGAMFARAMFSEAAYIDAFHGSVIGDGVPHLLNRGQAFLLEAVLSFLISSAYLHTALADEGYNGTLCCSAVGVARSLATFIGFRPLGQCANSARSTATAAASSIFLLNSDPWSVLYIYLFGNWTGGIFAAIAYWILRPHPLNCRIRGVCRRNASP